MFLTTGQTTKIRNSFANNISIDIKLSKSQISKVIQSAGSLGSCLGNWGKIALTYLAIPCARDNLFGLVSNIFSNAINILEREINRKEAVKAGRGFTLFILIEDMNDIIKIMKSLEDSGVLIHGVAETVKCKIKKARSWIYWCIFHTFVCVSGTTFAFFSSKRYCKKRS